MKKSTNNIVCLLALATMVLGSSICLATNPRYDIEGTTEEPVVTDHVTGLQWQQNTTFEGGGADWKDALAHCEGLSYAGNDDWRLPDVTELMSIVDDKKEEERKMRREKLEKRKMEEEEQRKKDEEEMRKRVKL